MNFSWVSKLAFLSISVVALAEDATTTATTEGGSAVKVIGNLEYRPGMVIGDKSLDSENTIMVGAKLSPTVTVQYEQYVNQNLRSGTDGSLALSPVLDVGALRVKVAKILENKATGTSLSYENRSFSPTNQDLAKAGMITVMRNYLKLDQKLSDSVTLSLYEIPILPIFSKSGFGDRANPLFENRVYLISSINITKDLSFTIPLMFHQTRFRDYATGAKNNNSWSYTLWIWPELDYAINETFYVGVAYYSGNLIQTNLGGLDIRNGLNTGVAQALVGANL